MIFIKYQKNDKAFKKSFNSYYEAVMTCNRLRKEGIKVELIDTSPKAIRRKKLNSADKQLIKKFLITAKDYEIRGK